MTWTIDPVKFAGESEEAHRKLTIAVGMQIDRRLVLITPVDTGRARSNWLPSIETPRSDTVGVRMPSESLKDAEATFNVAPKFPLLYLANNLPYIEPLNEGHSKQAPAGFVEDAIDSVGLQFK